MVVDYLHHKHQAEDLIQEASLKIHLPPKAGKYNDEGRFLPWAPCTTRNLCLVYLRKAKQKNVSLSDGKVGVPDWFTTDTAEDRMIKKELGSQLSQFIKKLSAEQAQLVNYRYYEDLSFREIAGFMNTSTNTSLGRMRYALGHLRKQIVANQELPGNKRLIILLLLKASVASETFVPAAGGEKCRCR